jgi:hypothetical protein
VRWPLELLVDACQCTSRHSLLLDLLGWRAASGPEQLRDSGRSHGCLHDEVSILLSTSLQVTVDDSLWMILNLYLLSLEYCRWRLNLLLFPLARSIKADCEETRQSS